jgi:hypothetical protein
MGAPKPPQIQPDPMLQQLAKTAQQQQIAAMQTEAEGDTASLLARYGARLALSGTSGGSTPSPMFGGLFGGGGLGGFGRR